MPVEEQRKGDPWQDAEQKIEKIQAALQRRFRVAGRGSVTHVQERLNLGTGYFKNQRRSGRRRVDLKVLFRSLDILGVNTAEFFASVLGGADPIDRFRTDAALLSRKRQPPPILSLAEQRTHETREEVDFNPAALDRLRHGEPRKLLRKTRAMVSRVSSADLPTLLGIHASACRVLHKLEEAQIVLARALELAAVDGPSSVLADLAQRASYVSSQSGDLEMALALSERATLIYVSLGDLPGVGKSLVDQGGYLATLDRTEDERQAYECALSYLPADSARADVCRNRFACLGNLSVTYRKLGDLQKTREFIRLAHQCAQESGPSQVGKLHWLEAMVARDENCLKEAEHHYQQAIDVLRSVAPIDSALCSLELVRTQLRRGAISEAYQSARQMTALVQTLHKNRIASAAVADCVRCALTGQGLSLTLLDQVARGLKREQTQQRAEPTP